MGKTRHTIKKALILLGIITFSLWWYLRSLDALRRFQSIDLGLEKGSVSYVRTAGGAVMIYGSAPMGALPAAFKSHDLSTAHFDILIITGTTALSYGGFIDAIETHDTSLIIEPDFSPHTKTYAQLQKLIAQKKIPEITLAGTARIFLDTVHQNIYSVDCPTPALVSSKYTCSIRMEHM